jgi:hypothetical protein
VLSNMCLVISEGGALIEKELAFRRCVVVGGNHACGVYRWL